MAKTETKKSKKYTNRKDGRIMTYVSTGKYLENGRLERITLYAKSDREMDKKVKELQLSLSLGQYTKPTEITLGEYADKWFETFKSTRSINTMAMYRNVIDTHIKDAIGSIKVKELVYTDVQWVINERFSHYETCNKVLLTLRQIEKAAIRDNIRRDEFCYGVELPKKPAGEKRALTEFEKRALTAADFTEQDKVLVYLLYGCGLRRGEVLALTVNDFDLKAHTVYISHVTVFDKNTCVEKDCPKSDSGIRTIPVPDSVWPVIGFYVRKKIKAGKQNLFTMTDGSLVTKSSYVKMWNRIIRQMQLVCPQPIVGLTAHIFRHNYATLLYYSNISELKAVALMGHSDGKMIREVYTHLNEEKEDTVAKLNQAIAL